MELDSLHALLRRNQALKLGIKQVSTPEEASGQQELMVVGSFNSWSVRVASTRPMGQRLLRDGHWQHECRVQLNSSGETEFQVLSKASVWEWCLYPEDSDKSTLQCGNPTAVKVGLSVLDGAHNKNFRVVESPKDVVAIKARISARDFTVWYDKDDQACSEEPMTPTWEVIGGADKGGIAVRVGASFDSETCLQRLSTGALIREQERQHERIRFERLSGTGPHQGWVSVRIPGKELLREVGMCANPFCVSVAPEVKKKPKKKNEPAPPPPPPPDEFVEWTGGRGVFVRVPPDGIQKQADTSTESPFWSYLETTLFSLTQGQYSPNTMAKVRRKAPATSGAKRLKEGGHCRVSVVTPTTEGRAEYHERLWACFQAQEWPDKELIVIDTADVPSTFFRQLAETHDELVYLCMQQKFSIGLKRNMAVHMASGDVLVNFDDDDIYAPNYIEVMVGHLEEHKLAALTLSAWHDYHVRTGRCGFVDPAEMHDIDLLMQRDEDSTGKDIKEMKILRDEAVEQAVFGYGFSYVHRRGPALSNPYPDSWFGEDLVFMRQLRWALGKHSVGLRRDESGICLHMMHGANTADSVAHKAVTQKEFLGLSVFRLKFDFATPPRWSPPASAGPTGKFFSAEWKARRRPVEPG